MSEHGAGRLQLRPLTTSPVPLTSKTSTRLKFLKTPSPNSFPPTQEIKQATIKILGLICLEKGLESGKWYPDFVFCCPMEGLQRQDNTKRPPSCTRCAHPHPAEGWDRTWGPAVLDFRTKRLSGYVCYLRKEFTVFNIAEVLPKGQPLSSLFIEVTGDRLSSSNVNNSQVQVWRKIKFMWFSLIFSFFHFVK